MAVGALQASEAIHTIGEGAGPWNWCLTSIQCQNSWDFTCTPLYTAVFGLNYSQGEVSDSNRKWINSKHKGTEQVICSINITIVLWRSSAWIWSRLLADVASQISGQYAEIGQNCLLPRPNPVFIIDFFVILSPCTNPRHQVPVALEFLYDDNIYGSLVFILLHITLVAPSSLWWLLDFWELRVL